MRFTRGEEAEHADQYASAPPREAGGVPSDHESALAELWQRLDEVLGLEPGATLRELLPTVPWREAFEPDVWRRPDIVEVYDDERRRTLHKALVNALGAGPATTLMELIPLLPWRDMVRLRLDPHRRLHPSAP